MGVRQLDPMYTSKGCTDNSKATVSFSIVSIISTLVLIKLTREVADGLIYSMSVLDQCCSGSHCTPVNFQLEGPVKLEYWVVTQKTFYAFICVLTFWSLSIFNLGTKEVG